MPPQPRTPTKAEAIPLVLGLTFVSPQQDGGYSVYAWVELAWRLYDWADNIADALRLARKTARRLREAGAKDRSSHG